MNCKNKINVFLRICIVLIVCELYIPVFSQWKSLPIRSQIEANGNMTGGEGEQLLHGFSRCLTQPNYIYACHDVMGTWRSTDGGTTWKHNQDKGLWLPFTSSIEVDPIDPNIVFVEVCASWWHVAATGTHEEWGFSGLSALAGLYRSTDGGSSWTQVLNADNVFFHRRMRSLIAWSKPSQQSSTISPTRWYCAFDKIGLYRSDASGIKGTWSKIAIFTDTLITTVVAHPTLSDVVYVGTGTGLYKSFDGGVSFIQNQKFAGDTVTSILINSRHPDSMYVVVHNDPDYNLTKALSTGYSHNGYYISADGGSTFTRPTIRYDSGQGTDVTTSCMYAFMNPGFPEQIFWVSDNMNGGMVKVSNSGGSTFPGRNMKDVVPFPGLNREKINGGWRWQIYNQMASILPDPSNKYGDAVATGCATMVKIQSLADQKGVSKPSAIESATGFTGNAWSPGIDGCNFHPTNPNLLMLSCNDVGPRFSDSKGEWFYPPDKIIGSWVDDGRLSWSGSYSADFQPLADSKVVVASVGFYGRESQLMRSKDYGIHWDTVLNVNAYKNKITGQNLINPYTKKTLWWNVKERRQSYDFVGFDPEVGFENYCYSGDQISKDAGMTFDSIKTWVRTTTPDVVPAQWVDGGAGYWDMDWVWPEYLTLQKVFIKSATPNVIAINKDENGHSHLFAVGAYKCSIFRSDDHASSWYSVYDNPSSESLVQLDRILAFAVHPTNPNIFFVLNQTKGSINYLGLRKVIYNPVAKHSSNIELTGLLNVLPSWLPAEVRACNKVRSIAIDPIDPNVMYVSMSISGIPNVYRSLDGGVTWASISDDSSISCHEGMLKVNPFTRELYRGSMSGTYIYPAPFNTQISNLETTNKIRLNVDKENQVLTVFGTNEDEKFSIIDYAGKIVMSFSGCKTSVSKLPSGIYILKSKSLLSDKFVK